MRKAIFIDKDGTLIPDIPYNVNTSLVVLEDKVIVGLKKLQPENFLYIIISNQSGIALGYFTEVELLEVESHISQLLINDSIKLDGFYYCPHFPGACVKKYDVNCLCRKPMPGLILKAAADFDIDMSQSWMIGDILNDVEAGNRAGARSILINNGNETEWLMNDQVRVPSFIAKNMDDAAEYILKNINPDNSLNPMKENNKYRNLTPDHEQ